MIEKFYCFGENGKKVYCSEGGRRNKPNRMPGIVNRNSNFVLRKAVHSKSAAEPVEGRKQRATIRRKTAQIAAGITARDRRARTGGRMMPREPSMSTTAADNRKGASGFRIRPRMTAAV